MRVPPSVPACALARVLRSLLAAVDRRTGARGVHAENSATVFTSAEVLVPAPAPFASSSYARARLLRQMHATGLLSPVECVSRPRLPPDC